MLSDRDRMVLEFARLSWRSLGRRDAAIRDVFGISAVRFSQILSRLLDDPAAEAYDPATVRRLRRRRDGRSRTRAQGFPLEPA